MVKKVTPAKQLIISHFLSYELWLAGKKLLDFQIEEKVDRKRRYYNTLNFLYFAGIKKKTSKLASEAYYKQRISNNAFYALEKEFAFFKYPFPKGAISVRSFTFFSYPMAVLYQAVGLYIAKITDEFIKGNHSRNIHSYYGGKIIFQGEGYDLIHKQESVSYYQHYKLFIRQLEDSTLVGANRWAIKLDIKDYFNNISIDTLIHLIKKRVKESILVYNKFDVNTIEQLSFFFRFLAHGTNGIPQADNNLASSYISYLYLFFGDLIIEDCINQLNSTNGNMIANYKIVRYVDDIHIMLDIPNSISETNFRNINFVNTDNEALRVAETPHFLLERIVNEFYVQLGLTVNDKARVHHLLTKKDRDIFLKKTLLSNEEITPFDTTNPKLALKKLILGIQMLNQQPLNKTISSSETLDTIKELLKCAFNNKVHDLLTIEENRLNLHKELNQLNFNKCHVSPKALTVLIANDPIVEKKFLKFASQSTKTTISFRNVLVNYICQKDHNAKSVLFKIIETDPTITMIINIIKENTITNYSTNYKHVEFSQFKKVLNCIPLLEQIRLRSYHELTNNYSICLNLLLNEIHFTCFHLDATASDINNYKATNVKIFLQQKGVDSMLRDQIVTLFDRRNSNPFSHPGSDSRHALNVNAADYLSFREGVSLTMGKILSN